MSNNAFNNENLNDRLSKLRARRLRIDRIKENPDELKKCKDDPLYFFNTYMNETGEELTQIGYEAEIKRLTELREAYNIPKFKEPLTPDECFPEQERKPKKNGDPR